METISNLVKAAKILGIVFALMTLRIVLEYLIVIFNINANLEKIKNE